MIKTMLGGVSFGSEQEKNSMPDNIPI